MNAVALLLGLGAAAAIAVRAAAILGTPETADAPDTVRVTRRDVGRVIRATGVIKPAIGAEVRVGSRVSGVVTRLHVRVGDVVRAGDLLAELDARELRARCDDAAAALRVAEANLALCARPTWRAAGSCTRTRSCRRAISTSRARRRGGRAAAGAGRGDARLRHARN